MNLALKYRPATLDGIIGQDAVVAALRATLTHIPHAILLTGPSGVGKTTIARIIASHLNADTRQVDATVFNGVEAMRELVTRIIPYRPLGREHKAIILEECHGLSVQAWQTLLLPLEEPPAYVYWVLTTTEPAKVPRTVRTRCRQYHLRSVSKPVVVEHLTKIASQERLDVAPDVIELCAVEVHGSVRQALTNLETVHGHDRKAARRLLQQPAQPSERRNGADLVAMVKQGMARDEIAAALHCDRTTVWRRLKKLVAAGVITEQDSRRR